MQEKILSTKILKPTEISRAVELLQAGELIAFPTETVYGLGAPLFAVDSVKKIFTTKGRPQDNPLIAHVHSVEEVEKIAIEIPEDFYRLAEAFFPGPLTIVLEAHPDIPREVSAGLPTIAVRCPSHPVAHALLQAINCPIVAPSANLSGKPSATKVEHVLEDFQGKIAAVIDGGDAKIGLESTVIGLQSIHHPILLRPGAITKEEIEAVLKTSLFLPDSSTKILSPGMKYRHYAPNAFVKLFFEANALLEYAKKECSRIILTNIPFQNLNCQQFPLESSSLYSSLRFSDKIDCDEILVFCTPEIQNNLALMNRLYRASEEI